ncbi:DNA polymerase III subunit gamma/tau [Paenibacillus sp. P96]|uniref:DNA-directed DNA polymerase n=1 Tax=Paenibacillus zeirhizosphaerae TaxID=2987519 RepID=A0ABT9FWW4_9BACL|nr:DNA polymerase III subunit gamma/tau [Paenibacillus sp. P96]MDP4099218.1 DNA polymerase III subunit gamma/tau [Paenibacillus sp. P96]
MEHIALYRAWRPQSFQDMVGQQHIIQTLQNAIREGRTSHAYLFSGPRGTGKTSAAKILAKAVNCDRGPATEPCNECESCKRITAGAVMDVQEIDAASNRGVEEIRDLRDKVKYAPTEVRQKVYIIDEVHMLTTEAFNALLKTLEEPPPHVMFILATTEPHRLPATIISRCQRFDFRRVSLEEQTDRLDLICRQENIEADRDALQYIARLSDGGMRDALSVLDQISSFTDGRVTYRQVIDMTGGIPSEQFSKLAKALHQEDVATVLQMIEGFMQEGKSADKCMENLLYYFRDLLMIKMVPQADKLTERVLEPAQFQEVAALFTKEQLFQMMDTLNRYQSEMKYAVQPQTLFEVALLKLCSIQQMPSHREGQASAVDSGEIATLKRQLSEMEKKLERALQAGLSGGSGQESAGNRPAASRAPAPRISTPAKLPSQLNEFIGAKSSPEFLEAARKWSQILQRVKEEKVTVHAWFMDGEPVSLYEDAVLVAFKNNIHRETTEKQANRQVIERVLNEQLGKSLRLVTMMQRDWLTAIEGANTHPEEEFKLEHEGDGPGKSKEPWIDEAIELFGEDLVVIKE